MPLEVAEELRACELELGPGQGVEGEVSLLDTWQLGLGGSHSWEFREAYRRLDSNSIGKGLLHGSLQWVPMKRGSLWF